MKVGITGQQGFIGSHLYNFLGLQKQIELVEFNNHYFEASDKLNEFVSNTDVIIHLAAVNRHADSTILYNTNVELVEKLINACIVTNSKPHILFSSSTQEIKDNNYGNSKKAGRALFEQWALNHGGLFTAMIIPNVFGPFGKPFYNSVIATFCHQLTHGETPTINVDGELDLIYINELNHDIYNILTQKTSGTITIPSRHQSSVSGILEILNNFKVLYLTKGIFPDIDQPFELALFNTFRCYVPLDHYPAPYIQNTDVRGTFMEIAKAKSSGQFSYSTTNPGMTRGNHFHTRKAERFAVIKGKAKISLRKINTSEVTDYILDGDKPSYVDMPIWHTHNITNIGEEELLTLFWINEPYNKEDPDTYFINV